MNSPEDSGELRMGFHALLLLNMLLEMLINC